MPKLSQQQVQAAQNQGYEDKKPVEKKTLPIADGKPYVYKLVACSSGPAKSNPNKIQWTWELKLDDRYHPEFCTGEYLEKLWTYTPVEGGQEWAIAKMLHAFGYSPDTDTDELINDEATVLAYLTTDTYGTPPKTNMKARRFAQHYDEEYPPAQGLVPPFGGEDDPHVQDSAPAVSVAKEDDPWATSAPAQASVPPQPQTDEDDEF
jgi:hypothetical protein